MISHKFDNNLNPAVSDVSDQKAVFEFHKCHLPSDPPPHNWQLNMDFPNKHISYLQTNLENLVALRGNLTDLVHNCQEIYSYSLESSLTRQPRMEERYFSFLD